MKITYWSDYACPYCYIGEKRLETAIDELGLKEDIDIEMRAFELDPNASYEVVSRTDERFAVKYGLTLDMARHQIEKISILGKNEGIDFKYIDTQYTNMLDAHRLTKLVASKGNGIEEDELNKTLDSDDFIDDVRFDENEAYKLGVHCNLTLTEGIEVNSPAIKEIPLTLECKVIYSQEQEIDKIPAELKEQFYPQNVDSTAPMANRDYHTVYYGEIVQAYIL